MAAVPALFRFVNASGVDQSGAKLYTYIAGTTTPQAVYEDNALSTPLANPAVSDAYGRLVCWFDASKVYKAVAKTSDDATTLFSFDNYDPADRDILQLIGSDAALSAIAAALSAAEAAGYATTAQAAAAAASASATAAAASETAAAASETAAASSETNAATSETNAATSETNAATSETNAAASAVAADADATAAADDADDARLDAISANLAENAASDLVDEFGLFSTTAYADVDAAVTAGATSGQLFIKTDDTYHRITGVGPNTSLQVSPLTTQQSTDLADVPDIKSDTENALVQSLIGLLGITANKGLYTDGTNSLASFDMSAYFRSDLANLADGAALTALLSLGDLASLDEITPTEFTGTLPLTKGGTGETSLANLKTALGLGDIVRGAQAVATGNTVVNTASITPKGGVTLVIATSRDVTPHHLTITRNNVDQIDTTSGSAAAQIQQTLIYLDLAPGTSAIPYGATSPNTCDFIRVIAVNIGI